MTKSICAWCGGSAPNHLTCESCGEPLGAAARAYMLRCKSAAKPLEATFDRTIPPVDAAEAEARDRIRRGS